MVVHFGHGFVIPQSDCAYPKFLSFLGVTQNLFMIVLFSDFYWRAYGKKKEQKKVEWAANKVLLIEIKSPIPDRCLRRNTIYTLEGAKLSTQQKKTIATNREQLINFIDRYIMKEKEREIHREKKRNAERERIMKREIVVIR